MALPTGLGLGLRLRLISQAAADPTYTPRQHTHVLMCYVPTEPHEPQSGSTPWKSWVLIYVLPHTSTHSYMISRPSHVNVSDMMLMPTDQAAARDVHRAPSKL